MAIAINRSVEMGLEAAEMYARLETAVWKLLRLTNYLNPFDWAGVTDMGGFIEANIAGGEKWIASLDAMQAAADDVLIDIRNDLYKAEVEANRFGRQAANMKARIEESRGRLAGAADEAGYKKELAGAARSLGYEAPTGSGRDRTETVDRKAATAARAAAKKAAKEEERLAAERLRLHQDLTEKIKDLTLNEYEFKRWTLDQEWEDIQAADAYRKASAEERTAIETEFTRYKVLALAEISKAEKEAAAERVKAAADAAEKIRRPRKSGSGSQGTGWKGPSGRCLIMRMRRPTPGAGGRGHDRRLQGNR